MKNFMRSLQYLKPYRGRITVSIVCVVFIACLWGSGLGLMLPGAKILLSDDGLHGWAWGALNSDRLGANLNQQRIGGRRMIEVAPGQTVLVESAINVVSPNQEDSPARDAGIEGSDWLIGLDDGDPAHLHLPANVLSSMLAKHSTGDTVALRVYKAGSNEVQTIRVKLKKAGVPANILANIVRHIPEPATREDKFPIFAGLCVLSMLVAVLRAFFTYVQEYLIGTAIWQGIMDLRCDNYNVVLHLPTTFFSERGVTDATSRFIQDTNELAKGHNLLLGKTLVEPAKGIASLAIALWVAWDMTVVTMLCVPPVFFLIRKFGKKMHRASTRALESWSTMLAVLEETLIGIRIVKSYTMEGAERKRFFRINRGLLKQQNRMERLDSATGPLIESMGIFGSMIGAGFAGYMVFRGIHFLGQSRTMTPEGLLLWMGALFALMDPIRKLAKISMRFQASEAAAARIFELQDMPQEKAVHNAPTLARHADSIEFKGVNFRYNGATDDVLKGINLRVKAAQVVAIVGPNGSGKTTLVSLVPRLIDPTAGAIFIDGHDISSVSVRSLRRQIGLVTQDTILFQATIAENIAYGLRRPKRDHVLDAARQAYVDDFVRDAARFPLGYDTMVGQHGATLSGGQRQRIAIARAILRDPAILIFDEAMSQVDSDSEQKIHQAMEHFMKGRTTLMIAHRFQTVRSADLIVVMDNGRIVDCGKHDELMARCELYDSLHRNQFQTNA